LGLSQEPISQHGRASRCYGTLKPPPPSVNRGLESPGVTHAAVVVGLFGLLTAASVPFVGAALAVGRQHWGVGTRLVTVAIALANILVSQVAKMLGVKVNSGLANAVPWALVVLIVTSTLRRGCRGRTRSACRCSGGRRRPRRVGRRLPGREPYRDPPLARTGDRAGSYIASCVIAPTDVTYDS
jgi:hypothetical protein